MKNVNKRNASRIQTRTEIELKECNQRFLTMMMSIYDGMIITDKDGRIEMMNPSAEELTGWKVEDAVGRSLEEVIQIINEKTHQIIDNHLHRVVNERILVGLTYNCILIGKKGMEHPVVTSCKPVFNENGHIGEVMTVFRKRIDEGTILKALKASEHKLRDTMDNLDVGYYSATVDGLLLDHNKLLNLILGFDLEKNIKGVKLPDFWQNPEERNVYLDRLVTNGYIRDYVVNAKKNNGEKVIVVANSHIVNNEHGELVRIEGTFTDFTLQMQAEEALRKSEEKYRNIFENIQDVYFETLIDGTILELSPAVKTVMKGQYQRGDLIGKSILTLYFEPEERQSLIAILQGKKAVTDYEITFKNRDGLAIPSSISAKLCFDTNGNPDRIIGSMRDISKRKQVEEELNNSRAQLLNAHLIARLGSWEYDVLNDIFTFNDPFYSIFHTTAEQAGGYTMNWKEYGKRFIYPDDLPFVISEISKTMQTDAPDFNNQFEHRFLYADGGIGYLSVRVFIKKDRKGKTVKSYGVNQDITEQKTIEVELRKAKEKAEESDRLKTAFLHNISHEIRTPMNAIIGFSALLAEPHVDEQSRQSYIEVITQSSNHLLGIIEDIIDISHIEANLVKIENNEININLKLKTICNQFLLKTKEKKIDLFCESGIPDSDAFIIIDGVKLTQILINLINNAIKFTDKGCVKVSCVMKGPFLEFCVSDTGIGIPSEYHKKIFERFYQVQHTLSRIYEGTGLGLAISKAKVELLGGKIWLSSEPGTGTSFFFTIPYERRVLNSLNTNEKNVTEKFVFPVEKTILVAEDDDNNFKLITRFLNGMNAKIVRASNGEEAVEISLAEKKPDLILMDIKMPVMDGYTATRQIREAGLTIPIIAQTAYAGDREKALESGCSGFISKPFDKNQFYQIFKEFI